MYSEIRTNLSYCHPLIPRRPDKRGLTVCLFTLQPDNHRVINQPMYVLFLLYRVIESKNPDFPVGTYVNGLLGWRSHTICKGSPSGDFNMTDATATMKLNASVPDDKHSLALGVLGMPG